MAQIIQGGAAMFNAVQYGRQSQEAVNFIQRQFDNISLQLNEAGRAFYQSARDSFEDLNNDYATRLLRAAGRSIEGLFMHDRIQEISSIGQFQHAPPVMQRWIMAEPTLRALHVANRIEGYSDTYLDLDPGKVGPAHYDYRLATNGLIFVSEPDENGDTEWHATSHWGALLPDDRELQFAEQLDIQATWRHLRERLENSDEDPTSRYNAQIG